MPYAIYDFNVYLDMLTRLEKQHEDRTTTTYTAQKLVTGIALRYVRCILAPIQWVCAAMGIPSITALIVNSRGNPGESCDNMPEDALRHTYDFAELRKHLTKLVSDYGQLQTLWRMIGRGVPYTDVINILKEYLGLEEVLDTTPQ
jgi:hypothetical protein